MLKIFFKIQRHGQKVCQVLSRTYGPLTGIFVIRGFRKVQLRRFFWPIGDFIRGSRTIFFSFSKKARMTKKIVPDGDLGLNYRDHCLIIAGDGRAADELLCRRRLRAGGRLAHFLVLNEDQVT